MPPVLLTALSVTLVRRCAPPFGFGIAGLRFLTVEGPQADPAAAGKAAFNAEYVACQSPTFYVNVGRSMARTQARKAAKSAILALLK